MLPLALPALQIFLTFRFLLRRQAHDLAVEREGRDLDGEAAALQVEEIADPTRDRVGEPAREALVSERLEGRLVARLDLGEASPARGCVGK